MANYTRLVALVKWLHVYSCNSMYTLVLVT
uniref:Uncharacterized protein n=1 Tax=Escherichia phage ETEP102 TaxID=3117680 RepID=A0AAU6PXI8_9CAUD